MTKLPDQRDETLGGYIVHGVPFPVETDPDALAATPAATLPPAVDFALSPPPPITPA